MAVLLKCKLYKCKELLLNVLFGPKSLCSILLHSAPFPHCPQHNCVIPFAALARAVPSAWNAFLPPQHPKNPTQPSESTQTPPAPGSRLPSSSPHTSLSPSNSPGNDAAPRRAPTVTNPAQNVSRAQAETPATRHAQESPGVGLVQPGFQPLLCC